MDFAAYKLAVLDDVKDQADQYDFDKYSDEDIADLMFTSDYVTGADSESYTMSRPEAEANITEALTDSSFLSALKDTLGSDTLEPALKRGAEDVDILVRQTAFDIQREEILKIISEARRNS